jgi:hypothetical protein
MRTRILVVVAVLAFVVTVPAMRHPPLDRLPIVSALEASAPNPLVRLVAPYRVTVGAAAVQLTASGNVHGIVLKAICPGQTIYVGVSSSVTTATGYPTLFAKPDAVYTLALPFIRAPRRLVYDSDTLPRFWGPAVYEEARLEWDLNQGNIALPTFVQSPRPRLTELIEHDNALLYSAQRVEPFQG